MIEILDPGTIVTLRNKVDATITATIIRPGNHIEYECAWWNGFERRIAIVQDTEIVCNNDTSFKLIGFSNGGLYKKYSKLDEI